MHTCKSANIVVLIALTLIVTSGALGQWIQADGARSDTYSCVSASGRFLFAGNFLYGVFRSSDDGAIWKNASYGLPITYIWSIAVSGSTLLVGTDKGVFLSSDNGEIWVAANMGLTDSIVYSFAVSGAEIFAGTNGGVFHSSNYGASWTAASTGLPPNDDTIIACAVSGANLFAGTLSGGVFRTSDDGANWAAARIGLTASVCYALAVQGADLFVGTNSGVFHSSDNGESWTTANNALSNVRVLSFGVSDAKLFAGTDDGVFLSSDKGASWTFQSHGLSAMVFSLAVSGANLIAGTDAGIWRRPLSEMITSVEELPTPDGSAAVIYPNPFLDKATIRFTTTERGKVDVRIVNLLGETVAQLFAGSLDAGEHSLSWDSPNVPRGAYYAIIREGVKIRHAALTLLR